MEICECGHSIFRHPEETFCLDCLNDCGIFKLKSEEYIDPMVLEDDRHEIFIELEKEIEKLYKFNKAVDLLNEQVKEFNLKFNKFVTSCKEYLIEIEA